jgi:CheY-like chemotaxis protein
MTENDEPHVLRVAISDTGVGMASETLEGLFLPLEPRPSHGAEFGLGLGLSLCHGIIEAHGGRMAAASPGPGRGATFEVHLPTMGAAAPLAPEPAAGDRDRSDRVRPLSPSRPLRILVVEDHTDSGAMLELLLTSRGHHVAVANSVSSALARRDDQWDVVISDLGLPDGSGLDVGRGMRDLSHRPRLIALSGYGRPADLAASQEAGFDIHLVKPLEPDRLFAVLEQ